MTIKKPTPSFAEPTMTSVAGGATIGNPLKLDTPDPGDKKASGAGTTIAVVAGLLALAVAGVLTFIIYQHWQYLANA